MIAPPQSDDPPGLGRAGERRTANGEHISLLPIGRIAKRIRLISSSPHPNQPPQPDAHQRSCAASGELLRTIDAPTPETRDDFGSVMAFDGKRLLIGATGSAGRGQVYLYTLAGPLAPSRCGLFLKN